MRRNIPPRHPHALVVACPPAASRAWVLQGLSIAALGLALGLLPAAQARGQVPAPPTGSAPETWPVLGPSFESGGGIVISEYRPMLVGTRCVTDFVATEPSGLKHYNVVEFEAVPLDDGHLCRDGKWRATNGSASGTTPMRIFIKDSVVYRAPDAE